MSGITTLSSSDSLPLTCSRSGTCCHGNLVMLNPWELAQLAHIKGMTTRDFRDRYCDWGGIRLLFNGVKNSNNKISCSQYIPGEGCSVYSGRPMVCRLFPLGRQKVRDEVNYIFKGESFPCLIECPEVVELPEMKVGDYLKGQQTEHCETAQDVYLDLMKDLVDGAYAMFFDSGLAATGDKKTLELWSLMGNEPPEDLKERLGDEWIDLLMVPELSFNSSSPLDYSRAHFQILQTRAQQAFGTSSTVEEFSKASALLMGLALHLARGLGANPATIVEHWVKEVRAAVAAEA